MALHSLLREPHLWPIQQVQRDDATSHLPNGQLNWRSRPLSSFDPTANSSWRHCIGRTTPGNGIESKLESRLIQSDKEQKPINILHQSLNSHDGYNLRKNWNHIDEMVGNRNKKKLISNQNSPQTKQPTKLPEKSSTDIKQISLQHQRSEPIYGNAP